MLYQSANFRNAVFVGYDGDMPAYAFKRNIFKDFKLEHTGSNKRLVLIIKIKKAMFFMFLKQPLIYCLT
ncbi:hypothetical protein [Holdemanella porci]|uniref:hypothetical protein n=1 Tax=Holdemanella porci TaxID=2652276 RepID=UPI003AEF5E0E